MDISQKKQFTLNLRKFLLNYEIPKMIVSHLYCWILNIKSEYNPSIRPPCVIFHSFSGYNNASWNDKVHC